jgi:DNA-binding transcriptional MerR regulator
MTAKLTRESIENAGNQAIDLLEKEITASQLNISSRKINHWIKEDLFPFKKLEGKWRSFSFIESCWVKLIDQLRELGYPIASIRKLKDEIAFIPDYKEILKDPEFFKLLETKFEKSEVEQFKKMSNSIDIGEENEERMFSETIFGLLLASCVMNKTHTYLLINQNGEFIPIDNVPIALKEAEEEIEEFKKGPHISIYLNTIISDLLIMPHKSQDKFYQKVLTKEENELINVLRNNMDAEQILIKLKSNGRVKNIDMLELQRSEKIDPSSRLTEIFVRDGYEEISLITEKGVIKSVKRKRKIKLANDK